MIAVVQLRVMDDSFASSAMLAERSDLVVQIDGDPEGNLLKAVARLEELVEEAKASMREQAAQLRGPGAVAEPDRPRPMPRRGRG